MMQIKGYLICWHDQADLGNGSFERFQPNAFANTAAQLTFAHDRRANAILGRAYVTQDEHGAQFTCALDEHDRTSRRVLVAIRNGLDAMSFTFRPLAERRDDDVVTVTRALLLEASITPSAYYQGGVWLANDEPHLPPRLAALAERYASARPLPVTSPQPRMPMAASRAAAVSSDPIRLALAAYMNRYLARAHALPRGLDDALELPGAPHDGRSAPAIPSGRWVNTRGQGGALRSTRHRPWRS